MNKDDLLDILINRFTDKPKRLVHIISVMNKALELNNYYQLNLDKDEIITSALLHDYMKVYDDDTLSKMAKDLGLDEFLDYPQVIHQELGFLAVKNELSISNENILDAIRYHTTGKLDMNDLTKLIFLSDEIEDERDFPGVFYLRDCALVSLDYGIYKVLEHNINYLKENNKLIHPNTINTYLKYKELFND